MTMAFQAIDPGSIPGRRISVERSETKYAGIEPCQSHAHERSESERLAPVQFPVGASLSN